MRGSKKWKKLKFRSFDKFSKLKKIHKTLLQGFESRISFKGEKILLQGALSEICAESSRIATFKRHGPCCVEGLMKKLYELLSHVNVTHVNNTGELTGWPAKHR